MGGLGRARQGVSKFPVENFLTHSAEKSRKETIFRLNANILVNIFKPLKTRQLFKISYPKVFDNHQFHQRFLYFYAKEGVSRLAVQSFRLTVKKEFVDESIKLSENFDFEKFFCMRRAYHDFVSKNFCLTVPKNFVRGHFLTIFLVSKKILDERGGMHHYFLSKFVCLTVPQNFVRGPFCFTQFLVAKKFMDKWFWREDHRHFLSKLFV